MKIPSASQVSQRAEYEVDEVMDEAPVEYMAHFDAPLRKLIRSLMVASFERGAAYVVEQIVIP